MEITEVLGFLDGDIAIKPLYQFKEFGEEKGRVQGKLCPVGELTHMDKLAAAGIVWRKEVIADEAEKADTKEEQTATCR